MPESEEVACARQPSDNDFQLRRRDIESLAALFAYRMVMVRHKDLAEFDRTLKSIPEAVDDTEFFEQLDGSVNGRTVYGSFAALGKLNSTQRAVLLKYFKNMTPRAGQAERGGLESIFERRLG